MAEIARFLELIITVYFEVNAPHHSPHFHIRYGEYRAVYGIDPLVQLAGALPRRQRRLIEAWAELHETELLDNWERVQQGQQVKKIAGLR